MDSVHRIQTRMEGAGNNADVILGWFLEERGMMAEGAKKGCRRLHARLDARATKRRRRSNREGGGVIMLD